LGWVIQKETTATRLDGTGSGEGSVEARVVRLVYGIWTSHLYTRYYSNMNLVSFSAVELRFDGSNLVNSIVP
jgi:hypothetical protein